MKIKPGQWWKRINAHHMVRIVAFSNNYFHKSIHHVVVFRFFHQHETHFLSENEFRANFRLATAEDMENE